MKFWYLDNCPKCHITWGKTFKRSRRSDAVVKDAPTIGVHWDSSRAGNCHTCGKRNFVGGQAVYLHQVEEHKEEQLLKECASYRCGEPVVALLKTPTGLRYCG